MQLSKAGLDLIKSFEGYHTRLPDGSCEAYRCPANVWTIGYGCTEGVEAGMVWTEAEASEAFARELEKHEAAVTKMVHVELTQCQFDALVSFSYNCGSAALRKSSLLKALNAGDFEHAATRFAPWCKARVNGKLTVLRGLVRRRKAEADMFAQEPEPSDIIPQDEPVMPQAVKEDKPKTMVRSGTANSAVGIAGGAGTLVMLEAAKNPSGYAALLQNPVTVVCFAMAGLAGYIWWSRQKKIKEHGI